MQEHMDIRRISSANRKIVERYPMKELRLILPVLLLCAFMNGCGGFTSASNIAQTPTLPNVPASLSYSDFLSTATPATPVLDSAFAIPANAAAPVDTFEGRLDLVSPAGNGSIAVLRDDFNSFAGSDSPWKHLAAFSFEFVQDGSHLIPAQQGLVYTGNADWNYIVGPGSVWSQSDDSGYTRASFPFALIERNQNCVHNGEMSFLFSNSKSPNISNVRYQIAQETCMYSKFNLWGQIAATYTPYSVANDSTIKSDSAAEIANRLPTKPLSALTTDFPNSSVIPANFIGGYQSRQDITAYGLFINGVNYVSGCQTRYGEYAFCSEMRLPSYSIAKSIFNGVASMRLGRLYGAGVYSRLIKDYVPEYTHGGDWSTVTFDNGLDMATGNYLSTGYMSDEDGSATQTFYDAQSYSGKIDDAIRPFPHQAAPGTTWVYQSVAAFVTNQAMNSYLQLQQGSSADIFNLVRDDVYMPLNISKGGLSTLRTGNSASGNAVGYLGLYLIPDDVAKIAKLLNNDHGIIKGSQVLDPSRLQESLFLNSSLLGLPVPDTGTPAVPNTYRYNNSFWGKKITTAEFPQIHCSVWASFMSGYGGITVVLMPNGATFYIFSDNDEYNWGSDVIEANKLAPLCP
jgi:hypothetical protein